LGSELKRKFAHFVEEMVPLFAISESADPARGSAGEPPRSWPKNSLSQSAAGMAVQFTRTKGAALPVHCLDEWPEQRAPCLYLFHQ
jgi:hypothetical protein